MGKKCLYKIKLFSIFKKCFGLKKNGVIFSKKEHFLKQNLYFSFLIF